MAKEKRSASDLDAELAALEAELAALENKSRRKGAKPAPAPKSVAPAQEREPPAAVEPAPAPTKEQKKSRFSMPKLGKKKAEPQPEPKLAEATSEPSSSSPPPASLLPPPSRYDLSKWRQEGGAWVRVVPETPVPVVRRVLDENGNLVREEAASMREVEDARGVKAERGLGRLLRRK